MLAGRGENGKQVSSGDSEDSSLWWQGQDGQTRNRSVKGGPQLSGCFSLRCRLGDGAATCDFLQGRPQTLMMFSVCFLPQRAKISQGTKAPEEKTTNTISKLDNNGNRDRMKLTDFNFLMVLGKGSFGKVCCGVGVAPTPGG